MSDNELRADVEAAKGRMSTKYGGRRELRKLNEHVWPDEVVERMATGRYGGGMGLLVMTDRRLIFVREGHMSSQLEDFPFSKISSVQWSTGMLLGKMTVFLSGNKADIDQMQKADGKAIADDVRSRISDLGATSAAAQPAVPAPAPAVPTTATDGHGPVALLGMLAVLRDEGILTPEEYTAKKLIVVDRM